MEINLQEFLRLYLANSGEAVFLEDAVNITCTVENPTRF